MRLSRPCCTVGYTGTAIPQAGVGLRGRQPAPAPAASGAVIRLTLGGLGLMLLGGIAYALSKRRKLAAACPRAARRGCYGPGRW